MRLWLGAFLVMTAFSGLARDDSKPTPCEEKAQRQIDLDDCALEELQNAEAFMAQTLKAIKQQHAEDTIFLQALDKAQQAWLTYRDAEIIARFPHKDSRRYYGSILGMCWNKVLAKLTEARTVHLRQWLKGVAPGEVCGGSFPVAEEQP